MATVLMPMASNHRAIDFRSLVKLENFRTGSSSSSAGMATTWNRLPMSIPAERGLTTLRRARRRRDGEDPGIDLLQLAKEGGQAGSALKSKQFPNRDQHHGRIQQCRRQGRERCGNPDHVSFRGRASKDDIGHGLTSPCPVWPRTLALAVGVSDARACRAVLVRFLAVMIQGTSPSRADSFPGWPNACCWCSSSDLSLWVDGADQQESVVT